MARWFGPRESGFGATPVSWQGWLATALVLGVVIATRFVRPETFELPVWTRSAVIGGAVLAYLILTFMTYGSDGDD
jgi:hypothetical protein